MSALFEDLKTHLEYFYQHEANQPNKPFLKQPYGNVWKTVSYGEAGQMARKMVTALRKMGLQPGDHIGIISKNCHQWIIADIALMIGGYVSTPLYPNLTGEQFKEVIAKSDTKAVFVGKLDTWDNVDAGLDADFPIIRFDHYPGSAEVTRGAKWQDLIDTHEPHTENFLPELSQIWTILFTSGTTGSPKGVIHDYENTALVIKSEVLTNTYKVLITDNPQFFSFLPLNHIAERTAVEILAILSGGCIAFAESLATFGKNLGDIQPTLFFAVPRIWTKFYLGVLAKMPQKKLDLYLKIPILSGIVKKKIKKTLGLSRANLVLTGASITPEHIKQFFQKLDINLREVYGMTENFGAFTLMPEGRHKPNTVGKPVAFAEGKIDEATGEILMKMPWMMKGYYKEEEKTKEVLVDDWLYTGDKGLVDNEGFFKIIGRVKDAFKTSKGKYVVPTVIEERFNNDYIEQICVAGLGIPQPVCLVSLSEIGLAANKAAVVESLKADLKKVNDACAHHERLSTLIIVKEPWSPDNKILTPTLKVKRGAIDERYGPQLKDWYDDSQDVIWE